MKKIFLVIFIFIVSLGFVACNSNNKDIIDDSEYFLEDGLTSQEKNEIKDKLTDKLTGNVGTTEYTKQDIFFNAEILEIYENKLLVEPIGIEKNSLGDKVSVFVDSKIFDLKTLKINDTISIYYNGFVQETYPVQVSAEKIIKK